MHRYVMEVYRAYEKGLPIVGPTYISKALNVSKSSACQALKNLAKKGYGKYIERKGFVLNSRGIEEAKKIIKKHRLLECFLAEIFSLDATQACIEASKIDVFASEKLIELIEEKFNYSYCPCGNKIP